MTNREQMRKLIAEANNTPTLKTLEKRVKKLESKAASAENAENSAENTENSAKKGKK